MAKEKAVKKSKSSKEILTPFIIGIGFLCASWFYWPEFKVFFIANFSKDFNPSITPIFILTLYLTAVLLVVFALSRLFKNFWLFLGTFLPIAIYLGYHEWNAYHVLHKTIDAGGLLTLLFTVFSKRIWW